MPYIEFFQYIDELETKKSGAATTKNADAAGPLLSKNQHAQLLAQAIAALPLFFGESEKEAEEALYVVCALVQRALTAKSKDKGAAVAKLVEELATALTSATEPFGNLRLKILTSVFNLIPPTHPARSPVFLQIIRFASLTHNIELVVPLLDKVDTWLAQWGTDVAGRRAIFAAIVEGLGRSRKSRHALAHDFLLKFLEQFQGASDAELATAEPEAVRAVVQAISVPDTYQFERYIDLHAVQRLARGGHAKLFELLTVFGAKGLQDFVEFDKENGGVLSSHDLARDACVHKMRLLSLCSLASSASSLPYADIAAALQIPEDEVERWVIRAVSAKLIDGRLVQTTRTLNVNSTTVRMFTEAQWGQLQSKLAAWRDGIKGLAQVLSQVKAEAAAE